MVLDHVAFVFVPNAMALHVLGRLSFPLFAWLLVQGEAHTRHIFRYGVRLLLLGVVSQPIYQLTFDIESFTVDLNILFELWMGLICLRFSRLYPKLEIAIWVGGAAIAEFLHFNYGAYGIALIALVRYYRPVLGWWLAWAAFHLLTTLWMPYRFQAVAGLAILMILATSHRQGPKARWFYVFYPGHLAVLYGLKLLIGV